MTDESIGSLVNETQRRLLNMATRTGEDGSVPDKEWFKSLSKADKILVSVYSQGFKAGCQHMEDIREEAKMAAFGQLLSKIMSGNGKMSDEERMLRMIMGSMEDEDPKSPQDKG